MRPTIIRWKRWAGAGAILLALYTVAGFWLVPWLIRDQVPKLGQSVLARPAVVGDVRFNPYTLRLHVQDLRLAEADGAPVAGVGALDLQLQWRSLLRWTWSFSEVRISEPSLHLTIAPDGTFNLAELVATLRRRPSPPPPPAGEVRLPRLVIERFVLERGAVAWNDRQAGYRNTVAPIDLVLVHFSTLPERGDAYSVSAETAQGAKIGLRGRLSVNPIQADGIVSVADFALPELAAYLKAYTGVSVASGTFGATLPFRFAYHEGRFESALEQARLSLHALALADERAHPPLRLRAADLGLQWQLALDYGPHGLQLRLADTALAVNGVAVSSGDQTPLTLARLGFSGGQLDLAARRASLDRVYAEGGQLQLRRDRRGQFNVVQMLPRSGAGASAAPAPRGVGQPAAAWQAVIRRTELSQFGVAVEDQGSGIKVQVQDLALKLADLGSDLSQAIRFDVALALREGGQVSAQGNVVPARSAVQAEVAVRRLALKPLQPLLGKYVQLKIASGSVSAQGRVTAGRGRGQGLALRYAGGLQVDRLALNDLDGDLFAGWKSVSARQLSAGLHPDRLDVPELRIVEPVAALVIEEDRSINAKRLRLRPDAPAAAAPAPPAAVAKPGPAPAPFPVNIRRVRVQDGKLDFADLSLLPPFSAKIYALNGVVNGLSSKPDARSQIELDGRVDEYGLARIRGELNPFAPSDATDVGVVFRNVDLVPVSPYTAKFAGYKIAGGRISLDLAYQVHEGQLQGDNHVVIDQLTLGERVDSPSALKLPVELAIAILQDSQGRIDLGLPVSGNVHEPQFRFGAVIWKAITTLIGRLVSAPFRALGQLLGIGGEALEAVAFDPGSAELLPPEREKLQQVARILAQRPQLKLTVPGQYSEAADGAALRAQRVRRAVATRAGVTLEAGESAGPVDLGDGEVRRAVRDLYAERFGRSELDRQRQAAQDAVPAEARLPLLARLAQRMEGEPEVADATAFYRALLARLQAQQPLAADALHTLGVQRAATIVRTLQAAGVDAAHAVPLAPEGIDTAPDKPVPLKLTLAPK